MAQMDKNNAFIYPTGFCEPIAAISVFLNILLQCLLLILVQPLEFHFQGLNCKC